VDSGILSSGIGARVLWDTRITFKTKQSDFIFLPRSFPDGGSIIYSNKSICSVGPSQPGFLFYHTGCTRVVVIFLVWW
jgi:hypothetical protein